MIRSLLALAVLLPFLAGAVVCRAGDSLPEDELKAAFVFNFTKYVKWPARAVSTGVPFRLGVIGKEPLGGNLKSLQGRPAAGSTIEVVQVNGPEDWKGCHLLFMDAGIGASLLADLQRIGAEPVLTVSDMPGFVRAGGIIGLKIVDRKVRFEVNLGAAVRAGLEINSQLLKMALEVIR